MIGSSASETGIPKYPVIPNALPNWRVLFGIKFLKAEKLFNIAINKPIATNANAADSIKGNSRPDLSNIPIKLIGIP